VRQFLVRNLVHIRDLIHVTHHNDGMVGAGAAIEASQDALALILLATPRVLILRRLLGRHDDVLNLVEPLCETGTVIVEKELLWRTRVTHFRFDKHETINVPVETAEPELKNVELIVKHKTIYEHLYE